MEIKQPLAVLAETGSYSFKHTLWYLALRYWTIFQLSHRNKSKYLQYFLLRQRNKYNLDAAIASITKTLNASLRSLIGRVMRKPPSLAQAVKDVLNKYYMNRLRTSEKKTLKLLQQVKQRWQFEAYLKFLPPVQASAFFHVRVSSFPIGETLQLRHRTASLPLCRDCRQARDTYEHLLRCQSISPSNIRSTGQAASLFRSIIDMELTRIQHDKYVEWRFIKHPLTDFLAARLEHRSVQHQLFPILAARPQHHIPARQ